MALVSVTCSNCAGEGTVCVEVGFSNTWTAVRGTCLECEGTGTILVHTSQINPEKIIFDRANEQDGWSEVWERYTRRVILKRDETTVFGQDGKWD